MSSTAVARMNAAINSGHFRRAVGIAEECVIQPDFEPSAQFYFQWGLARQLCGQDSGEQTRLARQRDDFTSHMAEDMHRDLVLAALRSGFLIEAWQLFHALRQTMPHDANREAARTMTWARLKYANGAYAVADTEHERAYRMWRYMGTAADQQWVKNNDYHWLKAKVMRRASFRARFVVFSRVIRRDTRLDRKIASTLMLVFGSFGVRLVNRYEMNKFRS